MFSGEKKFFYSKDIAVVNVPKSTSISLKYVLSQVAERDEITMYLPDVRNCDTKAMDRSFLFNIVNTIDDQFFVEEIEKHEQMKREKW